MAAPEIIHQLVTRFSENREAYHSGKYNEAQLRPQFLLRRKERLTREIESTDREIDRLVYELYGLSAEEIRIVEGS